MGFSIQVRVYWEDTDAGGIVYYANYLRYFERARSDWLRQCGIEQTQLKDGGLGMFVVHQAQLTYHAPARLDDLLRISVTLKSLGAATLDVEQEAWRLDPLTLEPVERLVSGCIKAAWVNPSSLKPAKIPASLRATLGQPAQAL